MARLASTSLVFMLWLTPAPAWKGSTRKASMRRACRRLASGVSRIGARPRISSAAWTMASQSASGRRPVCVVGARRGLLDLDRGTDERDVRPPAADREVADRALRLDAVVGVRGHLQRAQRVALEAVAGARSVAGGEGVEAGGEAAAPRVGSGMEPV